MPTVEIVYVDDEMATLEYEYESKSGLDGFWVFTGITHPYGADKVLINLSNVRSLIVYEDKPIEEEVV